MITPSLRHIVEAIPDGVVPYFQPIVAKDGHLSYEALGRLRVDGQLLTSMQFLPFLEGRLQLAAFDRQLIALAVAEMARCNLHNPRPVSLHVNVCNELLCDADFPQYLCEVLLAHDVWPWLLTVEILEHSDFWHNPKMISVLRDINRLGVQLAVDDFPCWTDANGLLVWLVDNQLGITVLKLDRSVIIRVAADDSTRADCDEVIRYIELARKAGMRVVAEGVETDEQALFMQCLGVDALQGFNIGRPAPNCSPFKTH